MKKAISLLTALLILASMCNLLVIGVTPQTNSDFSYNLTSTLPTTFTGTANNWVVKDGTSLKLNGQNFVSIGFTNYTHSTASYDYIESMMLDAKLAGFNVIRVCDMLSAVYYDGLSISSESWKNENCWKQTDFIIKTAEKLGMKVLLDLSTFRKYFYERSTKIDSYDPNTQVYWDEIVTFITNRTNTFTNKQYKNDPTIFSYAILGEPVPYGGALNTWDGGENSSRNAKDIVNAIIYIAKKLKLAAPNALIQTGGLLHIADNNAYKFYITSAERTSWGVPNLSLLTQHYYTDVLFASSYIDYVAIHLYPAITADSFNADGSFKASAGGEWESLSTFVQKATNNNKPFMVEEFGIDRNNVTDTQAASYFNYCFSKMTAANISHAIVWNLGYGSGFDVGPQAKSIWPIFKNYATLWGTTDIAGQAFGPVKNVNTMSISSQTLISSYEKKTSFSSLGGNLTFGTPSLENTTYTQGAKCMKVPVSLSNAYGWSDFALGIENTSVTIGTNDYLAVDVFIPDSVGTIAIRMGYKVDWTGYIESDTSWSKNYLIPGQLKTIIMPLTNQVENAYGNTFTNTSNPATNKTFNSLEFSIRNTTTLGDTYILFDNVRLIDVN